VEEVEGMGWDERDGEESGAVGAEAAWASDMEGGGEWNEAELRLRIIPIRGGLRRRLGETRAAFADRLLQRQRLLLATAAAGQSTTTTWRATKQQQRRRRQQRRLDAASATTIIDNLTRQLRQYTHLYRVPAGPVDAKYLTIYRIRLSEVCRNFGIVVR